MQMSLLDSIYVTFVPLQALKVPHTQICFRSTPVSSVFLPPGESKRKTLPSWLREELEKVERQRQKKLEKEAKEAARREQSGRPTWRDELDEEEEMEEGRERHRVTRSYRYSRSKSPNKVCGVVCVGSR